MQNAFSIKDIVIDGQVILAPMAGITDLPYRRICREMGAGLAVSEMLTSDASMWRTRKSQYRLQNDGEPEPRSIQIAGGVPELVAEAAKLATEIGAHIVDINMGCPAKKVCKVAAGSALMRDPDTVRAIMQQTRDAIDTPLTVKMRTGWCESTKNVVELAKMAEDIGLDMITVHGRTRSDKFNGQAEYDTIAEVVNAVSIPVVANGDIDSPEKAKKVLDYTQAQAIMVGRAAQGNPWLINQIDYFLRTGTMLDSPDLTDQFNLIMHHIKGVHDHYGEYLGVRIARKHIAWYLQHQFSQFKTAGKTINKIDNTEQQLIALQALFDQIRISGDRAA